MMADFSATPKEFVVGTFRAHGEYEPLWRYGGPTLALVTSVNDAQFGLRNRDANLLHTAYTGTGRWLRMDKPKGFDRIPDEVLARVRATEALRSWGPGK